MPTSKEFKAPPPGKCYFCKAEVSGDCYCGGCKEYICDSPDCDKNYSLPFGGHGVEDHKIDPEEDDDA